MVESSHCVLRSSVRYCHGGERDETNDEEVRSAPHQERTKGEEKSVEAPKAVEEEPKPLRLDVKARHESVLFVSVHQYLFFLLSSRKERKVTHPGKVTHRQSAQPRLTSADAVQGIDLESSGGVEEAVKSEGDREEGESPADL
jgi:nucleoid-associated protein YgaU